MEDPFGHDIIQRTLEIFDDDKLDRDWLVRNVLGGMAAGFGLRGQCKFYCYTQNPELKWGSRIGCSTRSDHDNYHRRVCNRK